MKTHILTRIWRCCRLLIHIMVGLFEATFLFPFRSSSGRVAAIYRWSHTMCRIFAMDISVAGPVPEAGQRGNTLVVANHVSWLDIFAINAVATSRFVAKSEVRGWPVLGWLCARTGTLFVTRERRHDTKRINKQIAHALHAGDCIAVFPEGSTSDGSDVLVFKASLLQPAIDAEAEVLPIAIRYLDQHGQASDAAAYIGEMSLLDSIRRLIAEPRLTVSLTFLPAIHAAHRHRRELAQQAQQQIAGVVRGECARSSAPSAHAITEQAG
ncbi:lysophospholipid acyltransferase family protein [Chitinimonas sp.]|uniref:lysophospholipid acyltransferase family protein n=1 Tax=Chitinimonas sp. TaxID=1934313 RepID=UPI0035AF9D31